MTVYENLDLPFPIGDVGRKERQVIVAEALDPFNIVAKKDLYPNQLSGEGSSNWLRSRGRSSQVRS